MSVVKTTFVYSIFRKKYTASDDLNIIYFEQFNKSGEIEYFYTYKYKPMTRLKKWPRKHNGKTLVWYSKIINENKLFY